MSMTVRVACGCGTSYEVKEQFAGQRVKCPQCGTENRVAGSPALLQRRADAVFDRDVFLLRQKMLRISEKYDVTDESGNKIVYVERPAHLLRSLGVLLAMLVAFALPLLLLGWVASAHRQADWVGLALCGSLIASAVLAVGVGVVLAPKRHVGFYRDAGKLDKLLEVIQEQKVALISARYTVLDPRGELLGRLAKNHLYDLFRKRWYVYGPSGALAYVAKEDSLLRAFLRRFLGPVFGLLRTNFVILPVERKAQKIGEFKRRFTILDRYVLDMAADRERRMDRRLALALGVMLDTGERR